MHCINHIRCFCIDFGLSQRYLDKNNKHVPPGKPARYGPGTVEFMSINAHRQHILSRRDDIEAAGYLFIYFLHGRLPWTDDLEEHDYLRNSNVVQRKKIATKIEVIIIFCIQHKHFYSTNLNLFFTKSLGGYAAKLEKYFQYARNLAFAEEPDYTYCRKLIDEALS